MFFLDFNYMYVIHLYFTKSKKSIENYVLKFKDNLFEKAYVTHDKTQLPTSYFKNLVLVIVLTTNICFVGNVYMSYLLANLPNNVVVSKNLSNTKMCALELTLYLTVLFLTKGSVL